MPTDPNSSLFYQFSGAASAPEVVFLHGGGSGSWMWKPVMDYLPELRCLAPDLPEHGESRSIAPFSMENAADLTAAFIRSKTSSGRAVVVGLSEGAQTLVALLSRHPEVVSRAILSSALVRPIPGTSFLTPDVLKWTYRTSIAPFRHNNFWIRLNMKYSAGIPDAYFEQFKKDFQEMSESNFVHLMHANQTFRLPEGLQKADAPTLIIAGQKEYRVMKQSACDIEVALPDAKAYLLDLGKSSSLAAEHNWALSAPQLFAKTVQAWMKSQPLPSELIPLRANFNGGK